MSRALLIVDIQNDYFPGGAHPLHEPEAAAAAARSVLDRFRASDEPVIDKDAPNAFLHTNLERELRERGVEELVVCGMMTSMCVDATVRAAADLGFSVTLVHDACAAPALSFGGTDVPAPAVGAAFIAALGEGCATLASAAELS